MLALEFREQSVRLRSDVPIPDPPDGEVLVRVLRAGVCETDLQLVKGYMGFAGILGHEFVGVAETGPLAGQRVVGEINCSCETCDFCRAGLRNHCPHRSVLGILNRDGAFAEYLTLPAQNLHVVPENVSTEAAVFTEPLAAAFQIPTQIPLNENQRVIVLGDGRLGNLCAQVIAMHDCQLTVIGKHPEKLALLERLGIETKLLADLKTIPMEQRADIVVDCTGSPTGVPTALQLVKPRGTIVLKTTVAGDQTLALAPFVIDEITLIGSRCGPFPKALEALAAGRIDVEPLVTARFHLSDAVGALDYASKPGMLKVLLTVTG